MSQQTNDKSLKARLTKTARFLNYKFACWQGYCPTAKEIENSEIKSLADRLKGNSYEETLTNILEWQDRNINFWTERHPLSTIFSYFTLAFVFIGILGLPVILVLSVILKSNLIIWFVATIITILLTGSVLILFTMGKIIHSNRKIPVFEGLKNAFSNSIPINALLENKLGICRDYAKLTASLLFNIYPNGEIYFAHAPGHVATGLVIENRLYMLDQRLPILTLGKWNSYRHLRGKLHKLEINNLKRVDPNHYLSIDKQTLDTLAQTMMKLLKIKEQTCDESNPPVKIRLRKGSILYQDDEMVNYSLSRWLQTKTSMELIELSQITRIEVSYEKEDLVFLMHLQLLKLLATCI